MNIAIFGGAFDPFTMTHLNIVRTVASMSEIFMLYIEPAHDKYKNIRILWKQRVEMIKLGLEDFEPEIRKRIKIGFYDAHNDFYRQPFAFETLDYYSKIEGIDDIYYVIGSDQLKSFEFWKNPKMLAKKYKWIVFERDDDNALDIILDNNILKKNTKNICIFPFGSTISSTKIRHELLSGLNKSKSVPEKIMKYINEHKLYRQMYIE